MLCFVSIRSAFFHRLSPSLAVLAAVAFAGCTEEAHDPAHNAIPDAQVPPDEGKAEFESALAEAPISQKELERGVATSSVCAPAASSSGDESSESEIALAAPEEELHRVEEDRLYTLSRGGGLEIFDISAPEKPRMLARHVVQAAPTALYLRSGIAYGVYALVPIWSRNSDGAWNMNYHSRVLAFDVRDPTNIVEVGSVEIPGHIRESWLDGSVIYTASFEDGSCSGCEAQARTVVTSVAIDNPASIHQVAQLGFETTSASLSGGYEPKVAIGAHRFYVSGMVYDGGWGEDTGHSIVRVIDASDSSGQLTLGAEVEVAGEIPDRWAMSESDGALRVFSQSGSSWTGGPLWLDGPPPTIETFKVTSAQALERTGSLAVQVPGEKSRITARFDGARGYLVGSVPRDPVVVLDLSDATHPLQGGTLLVPGWLQDIQPRGNRLLALSTNESSTSGSMTASLFDVSKGESPVTIYRTSLGGPWTWASDPHDWSTGTRVPIRKAFQSFDAIGLISVPFSGYTNATNDGTDVYPTYTSGVQLLELSGDTITTRGIVPLHGQARRAFVHRDRWLALSNDELVSFDIGNRDAPQRLDSVGLGYTANESVRTGSYLVSLSEDSDTKSPRLVVVPAGGGISALPIATVDLGAAIASTAQTCWDLRWPNFAYYTRLFANGSQIYVVYDGRFAGLRGKLGFGVLELADPVHPVLTHKMLSLGKEVSLPSGGVLDNDLGLGSAPVIYHRSALYKAGERIVRLGNSLAIQELAPISVSSGNDNGTFEMRATLHVVDLSNPAEIQLTSSMDLGDGPTSSGLFVDGGRVLTSHYEPSPSGQDRARFFLDEVELATPASPNTKKVSIPGSLLGVDSDSQRILTVDYERTVEMLVDEAYRGRCRTEAAFGSAFELDKVPNEERPVPCVRVDWSLKLVDVSGPTAKVLDSLVPTGAGVRGLALGTDRVYLARVSDVRDSSTLEIFSGMRDGHFSPGATLPISGYYAPDASGTRIADGPSLFSPNLVVYDTADPAAPVKILDVDAHGNPLWWGGLISLDSDYAILSTGPFGAIAIPLPK